MKGTIFRFTCGVFFLMLCLSSLAIAQSAFTGTSGNISRESLGLYGGQAEDLAIGSNGYLYLALNSPNGIFCSTDGATTWTGPPEGSDLGDVCDVEIGSNDSTIFIIGGIQLYKSIDAGQSFTELTIPGVASDFGQTMVYSNGTLLVAFRDGTIYKSSDEGASFTNITLSTGVTSILALAASPSAGIFYALASNGSTVTVFKSMNSGSTWTEVGATLNCTNCTELRVNPNDATQLVTTGLNVAKITDDDCSTWSDITPTPGMASSSISFIGTRLYIGSKYTEDGGTTWNEINEEVTSSDTELFSLITSDPNDPNTLYMVSLRGFAKSTDGGANWSDSVEGILGVVVNDIAQSTDKNTVYLAVTAGIAKSIDFTTGPTWSYPIDVTGNGSAMNAVLLIDPTAPDTVLAGAGRIYLSNNGGTSWTEATISSSNFGNSDSVTDFAMTSNGDIIATFSADIASGGVLISTDSGSTWSDLSLTGNPPANTVATLGNTVIVGTGSESDLDPSKRGIFVYDGSSWTEISGDIDDQVINNLLVDTATSTIYAAAGETSEGSVYRSYDSGSTWEDLLNNGLPADGWFHSLALDPSNTSIVFAASGRPAGNAVIMKTEDGGDSWVTHYTALKDEIPYAMLVDGLMVGFNTGIYSFESTSSAPDGGSSTGNTSSSSSTCFIATLLY